MRKGTVLITGASTGIGQATALLLDRLGYRVFAGYRRQADAEALRAAGSMNLRPVRLDVTDPEDVQTAVAEVNEACGAAGLTALINNAGYTYVSAFECTEEVQARALMETNFFGLYRLSQACLPLLRRKVHHSGGTAKLINIGSVGSLIGIPWQAFYHASKFACRSHCKSRLTSMGSESRLCVRVASRRLSWRSSARVHGGRWIACRSPDGTSMAGA
jgi:NAD(P)-dependent dehydrogenase (short-subunit alcohol dehydrogenase family)